MYSIHSFLKLSLFALFFISYSQFSFSSSVELAFRSQSASGYYSDTKAIRGSNRTVTELSLVQNKVSECAIFYYEDSVGDEEVREFTFRRFSADGKFRDRKFAYQWAPSVFSIRDYWKHIFKTDMRVRLNSSSSAGSLANLGFLEFDGISTLRLWKIRESQEFSYPEGEHVVLFDLRIEIEDKNPQKIKSALYRESRLSLNLWTKGHAMETLSEVECIF